MTVFVPAGCGGRSDLWIPPDVTYPDVRPDRADAADDGREDEGPPADGDADDAPETDACGGPCDDGNACTADRCDPLLGCMFEPLDPAACDDGVACTVDGCDPGTGCWSRPDDAACDDGDPCTGREACDPALDCVPGAPPCDDGNACTADTCEPATGACGHEPDDAACDDDIRCTVDRCDPTTGCENRPDDSLCDPSDHCDLICGGCVLDTMPPHAFLAFTLTSLYRINIVTGTGEIVRRMAGELDDIAITSDGRFWGNLLARVWAIDRCYLTGRPALRSTGSALAGGLDGRLWALQNRPGPEYVAVSIDPDTGEMTVLSSLEPDVPRPADLAASADGRLYAAAEATVYVIEPETGRTAVAGWLPAGTVVEALAVVDGRVYGLTADGLLYELDLATTAVTLLGTIPPDHADGFLGAGGPP